MEEIEYLEEYEDLVLPAINSAAGAAASTNSKSVHLDSDGSSSSLDQDIFNCLFDDNSDDDSVVPNQPLKEQNNCSQKDNTQRYLDRTNDTLNEIGFQITKELSLDNRTKNVVEKDSSTKGKCAADPQVAIHSKSGGPKTEKSSSSSISSNAKAVATVRPTVQQIVSYKKQLSIDSKITAATSKQNSAKSLQGGHQFARNQTLPTAKAKFNTKQQTKPSSVSNQRPATIVKPEKIITKDPAEDPLNVDASSLEGSDNSSISDISGETYNSISDFDDDDDDDDYDFAGYVDTLDDDDDDSVQSQVIDISNDSSESRSHIEELRGSTPSPVVSEDRCSLPKLMANREIIKSLLRKDEKPKLLNLINEHEKDGTLKIQKSIEKELFELSTATTSEKNKRDLKTKQKLYEPPPAIPAKTSQAITIYERDLPSESHLQRSNAEEEKPKKFSDNMEKSRSEMNKPANSMRKSDSVQTEELKKNKNNDLPNNAKTSKRDNLEIQASHSTQGNRDKEHSVEKAPSDKKYSKFFEKNVQAEAIGPKKISGVVKEDEVQAPTSKEGRDEKELSVLTPVRAKKKRFRNLRSPEGDVKEVFPVVLPDRKSRRSDIEAEIKTKQKSEQNAIPSVSKTLKQDNLESKKGKIQEQSKEELKEFNSNRKGSNSFGQTKQSPIRTLVKSNQTPALKEQCGEKESSRSTSTQVQRKRIRNPTFSKGSNEEKSTIPRVDNKGYGSDDVVTMRTVGVTGSSSLSAVESQTKKKSENKGNNSSVKSSTKQVSLDSQKSTSKIGEKDEHSKEKSLDSQTSSSKIGEKDEHSKEKECLDNQTSSSKMGEKDEHSKEKECLDSQTSSSNIGKKDELSKQKESLDSQTSSSNTGKKHELSKEKEILDSQTSSSNTGKKDELSKEKESLDSQTSSSNRGKKDELSKEKESLDSQTYSSKIGKKEEHSKEEEILDSQTSSSKIVKKDEHSKEESSDKKLLKSLEQKTQSQSFSQSKSNQSEKNNDCTEKFDEATKPVSKEIDIIKESLKLQSPQPQRKRFRNRLSKGNEKSGDKESELSKADSKGERSEFSLVGLGDKTSKSASFAVDDNSKGKPELNVSFSVSARDSTKNLTKVDLSNTSNRGRPITHSSTDSSRDISNKYTIDVPKGVKINPFVQRTAKNILVSKECKTPVGSSRNNSRESSIESSRNSKKEHVKDNDKSFKSGNSETHNQQEFQKKFSEKGDHNLKPNDKVVCKNMSKDMDTKSAVPLNSTKTKDTTKPKPPIHLEAETHTKPKKDEENSLDSMPKDPQISCEKTGTTVTKSSSSDGKQSQQSDEKSPKPKHKDKDSIKSKTLPTIDTDKTTNKDKVDSKGQKQMLTQSVRSTHDTPNSETQLNKKLSGLRESSTDELAHETPFPTVTKVSVDDGILNEHIKSHSKEEVATNKLLSSADGKNKDEIELPIAKPIATSKCISPSSSHSHNAPVNKKKKEIFVTASTKVNEDNDKSKLKSSGKPPSADAVDSNIMNEADMADGVKKQGADSSALVTKQSSKAKSETSALKTGETSTPENKERMCDGADKSKVIKGNLKGAENPKEILDKFTKNPKKSEIAEKSCIDTKDKQVYDKPTTKLQKSESLTLKVEDEKNVAQNKKPSKTNINISKSAENVCLQTDSKDTNSAEKQHSAVPKDTSSGATTSTKKIVESKAIEARPQGDKLNDPPKCDKKEANVGKLQKIPTATIMSDDDDNANSNNKLKKNQTLELDARKDICHTKEKDAPLKREEDNESENSELANSVPTNTKTNKRCNKDEQGIASDLKDKQDSEMPDKAVNCKKIKVKQHVDVTSTVADKTTAIDNTNLDLEDSTKTAVAENSPQQENEKLDAPSAKPIKTTKESATTNPQNYGIIENAEENVTCNLVQSVTPNNRKTRSSKPEGTGSVINPPSNSPKKPSISKEEVSEKIPAKNKTPIKKTLTAEDFDKFEKEQLAKQINIECSQKAVVDAKKVRFEKKPTVHDKSTAENDNMDGTSLKPKATTKDSTNITTSERDAPSSLTKSVTQNNRKTRNSKPDGARLGAAEMNAPSKPTTKDLVVESVTEMKKNSSPGELEKSEKNQLEKSVGKIPQNALDEKNTFQEAEPAPEDKKTDQNSATADNHSEIKIPNNPLKTVASKDVAIKNSQDNNTTQANNKNQEPEVGNTSGKDQVEKQNNKESQRKEATAGTSKIEIDSQAEGKSANTPCMRKTRSSVTTEDEESYSTDDNKSQSPYNIKTAGIVRRNRNTPSKGEGLIVESFQTEEPVVAIKGKSKIRDESSTQNSDKIESNTSPQKRIRLTRIKADGSGKLSDIENNSLTSKPEEVVLFSVKPTIEKTPQPSNSPTKKSENKTGDDHPDKVKTSGMNTTEQTTIQKTNNDSASTLCLYESSSKLKTSSREDTNNKQSETIAKKTTTPPVEEAPKNFKTLSPVKLTTRGCTASTDSKLTVETTTTKKAGESLDTVTVNKKVNLAKEVPSYFADRTRRLRKRGSELPFCENRDGDKRTTFKTPTIVTSTGIKTKRRLRSPASERDKELQQPLAKKMKIDQRKARNRNPDIVIPPTGVSSTLTAKKEFTETSNETNSTTSELHAVVTPIREPSSVELRSAEKPSQISTNNTFMEKVKLPCDNTAESSIDKSSSSLAETKEKEHEPEWLKGNDKNDSATSLQELRTRTPVETIPNQVTKTDSNILGQQPLKRGRKPKTPSSVQKDADNTESLAIIANASEIAQENNNPQSQNIQGGLGADKVTEIVPEKATNSITENPPPPPPSTETTDSSTKRGRKLQVMPNEKNDEATSCTIITNRNEMLSNADLAQDITKQNSSLSASSLEDCSNEKAKEITKDLPISPSLADNRPPQKSERRGQIKTSQDQTLTTMNKDEQKIKGSSLSTSQSTSTKQDKKFNKRSEIDVLIESMPKEMKDSGIKDLLSNSGLSKRQRVLVKRVNIEEFSQLAQPSSSIETRADSTSDDNLKRPQTRRSLPKKLLANTTNSNQSVKAVASAPLQIHMEKTLIDEVEIKNMNTSLVEPLKKDAKRPFCSSNVLKPLKTAHSLPTNDFKMPKLLSAVNRDNTGHSLRNFGTKCRSAKCRRVKVVLNRRVVKKYFENVKQLDVATSADRLKTIIEPAKCAITLPTAQDEHLTQQQSEKNIGIEVSPPEVKEITTAVDETNLATLERDSNAAQPIPTEIVGSDNSSVLYSKAADNITNNIGRSTEDILADSVMTEPAVPIELKNEFLDENPIGMGENILPDTPTLIARSQTITQAAANALSNTIIPTGIRLLTNDPISTRAVVPSFGVTPTLVDARGTRMYTFLHPAKYSRNHGNVLLDYCCPNLDGPMPAIDPTRIHAQVQTPVIELPSCIVLTTKVVTRAELECKNSSVPDVIRKKAHKIRSNVFSQTPPGASHAGTVPSDIPTHFPNAPYINPLQIARSTPEQKSQAILPVVTPAGKYSSYPVEQNLSPTVNALAKCLPSTTTITPKIRPPLAQTLVDPKGKQNNTSKVVSKAPSLLNETQQLNLMRSNLRQVDVILKSLVQPFDKLNFTERQQVVDNLVASGKFLPYDIERAIVLAEEYLKQIKLIGTKQITEATSTASNIVAPLPRQLTNINPIRMAPVLQLAPKPTATVSSKTDSQPNREEIRSTTVRKVQSTVRQHSATVNTSTVKQRQVPIYDTERNIIGYQLQVLTPNTSMTSYRKSSSMTASGGNTSTLGASSNTQRKPLKRPAQDSPRVFYTSPPLKTSAPISDCNTTQYLMKPMGAVKSFQGFKNAQNGESIMTTSAGTEKITTTTMATVKRVTRSCASGSNVIIVSKSSSDEIILPDINHPAEIKHERDVEDFTG